jgi:hypothetical protein
MHFHDLRHTHKTWLIEDDIPEVAQAKRLGHRLAGVRGIYSHVTPAMVTRIVDALETPVEDQRARSRRTRGGMTIQDSMQGGRRDASPPLRRHMPPAPRWAAIAATASAGGNPAPTPAHDQTGQRQTIMCSQFAPNVRSTSKTARYHIFGNEPLTCCFSGGRYRV